MPTSWRATSARPCPVCGDTKQRCKIHDEGNRVWCRNVLDGDSALLGDQWRYVKPITGGPGGSIIVRKVDEDLPAPKKSRKGKPKKDQAVEAIAEEPKQVSDEGRLEGAEAEAFREYEKKRHEQLKGLIASNELTSADRKQLKDRGMDEQQVTALAEIGIRSIQHGKTFEAAKGGPGITDEGVYLGPTGFLIPAFRETPNGRQYIGMQVATCQEFQADGGGKYIWLSLGSEKEARRGDYYLKVLSEEGHLDSMPLFSYSSNDKVQTCYLVDSALKTYLTGMRQGQAAMGSPGMQFSTSMGQLRDGLRRLVGMNSDIKFAIAPDAGDPDNTQMMATLNSVANAVRDWGYRIDWVNLDQEKGKQDGEDIDETNVSAEEMLDRETFFHKMGHSTRNVVRKFESRKWEFGFRPMAPKDVLEPQLCDSAPVLYGKGERTKALAEQLKKGNRVILDVSGTGAGKSFWWSHLDEDDLKALGVDQVAVLSERHMEQADEFGIPVVRGRQPNGVKRTEQGRILTMGRGEELVEGETLEHGSNCIEGDLLAKFQERKMAKALSSLCTMCESRELCEVTSGAYRFDRASALQNPVVVMHPKSFQEQFLLQQEGDDGINMPRTGVVLDDVALQQMLEDVVVGPGSVIASLRKLSENRALDVGVQAITKAIGQKRRMESEELKALAFTHFQGLTHWDDIFNEEEAMVGNSNGRLALRCWMPFFKAWLEGKAVAHLREDGFLVFKTFADRLRNALRNAAWVVFLDATASPVILDRLMGVRPEMIAEERWLTPADLKITQIQGLGVLGYTRRPQQQFQLKVALAKLKKAGRLPWDKTAIIDTKGGLELSGGYGVINMAFLSDSRGSNRAYQAKCETLALIGSPNTNLADAAATYELLFGDPVDLKARRNVIYPVLLEEGAEPMVCCEVGSAHVGFSRFYAHLRRSELLQALGRLRANIREGEVLQVIVLGDSVMPFPVRLAGLAEVIDDENMSDWLNCNDGTLKNCAWAIKQRKQIASVEAIAAEAGLHPLLVQEWVDEMQPEWLLSPEEQKARQEAKDREAFLNRRHRARGRRGRRRPLSQSRQSA